MHSEKKKNRFEIDMCNGSIMNKLISFSIPLMLSGILQLAFNAVDIVVVGRFSGSEALAAVGSTTALINVFTNLFIGISLGANVLAARFYAAGREKEMSETVHTAITFAIISGVVMALVGLFFSRGALELMGTPDNVINLSTLYMKIYFLGMCGNLKSGWRYEAATFVFDCSRCDQCVFKPFTCNCFSSGSGGCCNCNCDSTVCIMYFGTAVFI